MRRVWIYLLIVLATVWPRRWGLAMAIAIPGLWGLGLLRRITRIPLGTLLEISHNVYEDIKLWKAYGYCGWGGG